MAHVLIVDDSPEFRTSIGACLQKAGHEALFASDGQEALNQLKSNAVDLVLLDYQMPVWDGVESMVLFRSENLKQPVIAYTCQNLDYRAPFESVMESLGTIAAVRCKDGAQPLISKVEQFLSGAAQPAPSNASDDENYPATIDWQNVRMLNIEPLAVSILFKDKSEPTRFEFESRVEMEETLARWFHSRPVPI